MHKCNIVRFKMCGLKYTLKYKIQIKFKCVPHVLYSYYVVCHHPSEVGLMLSGQQAPVHLVTPALFGNTLSKK